MGKTVVGSVFTVVKASFNLTGALALSALFAMLIAPLGARVACDLAFLQGPAGSGPAITGQQDPQTPML